jgi:hypothetical protein
VLIGSLLVDVASGAGLTVLFAVPLAVTLWALLDVAHRPQWAWALSGHRQVVWLVLVIAGGCSVVGGLAVSGWYLLKVRPRIAAAEDGRIA